MIKQKQVVERMFISISGTLLEICANIITIIQAAGKKSHWPYIIIAAILIISSIVVVYINIKKRKNKDSVNSGSQTINNDQRVTNQTTKTGNTTINIHSNENGKSIIKIRNSQINTLSIISFILLLTSVIVLLSSIGIFNNHNIDSQVTPPPITTSPITTIPPTTTPPITPPPFSFVDWWKETIKTAEVTCKLPIDKADVYPPGTLSKSERNNSKDYVDAYIDKNDNLKILDICTEPETGLIIATIEYTIGKTSKTKEGSIELTKLIDIKTDENIEQSVTAQTTILYSRPSFNQKSTTIEKGTTIFLLGKNKKWRQILYYKGYNQWKIVWVRIEELVKGPVCIIQQPAHFRSSPSAANDKNILSTLSIDSVYTIQDEEKDEKKATWYKIYTQGQYGWVHSSLTTREDE